MKIHHFLTTLFLAAPLCLGETAAVDSDYDEYFDDDYEEPEDIEYTLEEQVAAFNTLCSQMQQIIDCVQGVTDTASADAAAPILTNLRQQMNDSSGIRAKLINFEPSEEDAARFSTLEYKVYELREKLEEVFFYSSEELAKALTNDAQNAHAPLPMTPEIEKELSTYDKNHFNISINDEDLFSVMSGGPGFSRETAWICSSKKAATAREFARDIILSYQGRTKTVKLEERVIDGKTYQVVTAYFTVDGARYVADVWTDITIAANQYTPEKKKEALDTYITYAKMMYETLQGVHDKASADAAADTILLGRKKLTDEVMDILRGLDTQILIDAQNQHLPAREEIYAVHKRIRDNEYYGSEKLRNL